MIYKKISMNIKYKIGTDHTSIYKMNEQHMESSAHALVYEGPPHLNKKTRLSNIS